MEKGVDPIKVVTTAAAVVLCAAAVVALVRVLGDSDSADPVSKVVSAAVMLILFSPIGLAGVALSVRRPALAWFGYATTGVAFVAFVILTQRLWDGGNILFGGDDLRLPGVALVVAIACGQVSLLLAWARSGTLVRWVGLCAVTSIIVLAVLGVLEIVSEIDISDRVYGVLTILYLLPVALLPLLTLGRGADSAHPKSTTWLS
jgi:hypothetical protein